jgi:hypothetical protein
MVSFETQPCQQVGRRIAIAAALIGWFMQACQSVAQQPETLSCFCQLMGASGSGGPSNTGRTTGPIMS